MQWWVISKNYLNEENKTTFINALVRYQKFEYDNQAKISLQKERSHQSKNPKSEFMSRYKEVPELARYHSLYLLREAI